MLSSKRIFQTRKYLNFINTSNVIKCDYSKKSKDVSDIPNEKKNSEETELKNFAFADKEKEKTQLQSSEKSKKTAQERTRETQIGNLFNARIQKKKLKKAVEALAEDFGENKTEVQKDLMNYLKTFKIAKEEVLHFQSKEMLIRKPGSSIQSLLKNIKTLYIFDNFRGELLKNKVQLNIWDALEKEELEYLMLTHPRNQFEEFIEWTNKGKLWHFPIDNDQGLDEESKVSFTQHVFLEKHLEHWCPERGPLRRFMDLVLIGLGKNPHLSVQEKIEHIQWFKDYFENKRKLLKELGAMDSVKKINSDSEEKFSKK